MGPLGPQLGVLDTLARIAGISKNAGITLKPASYGVLESPRVRFEFCIAHLCKLLPKRYLALPPLRRAARCSLVTG